MNRFHWICVKCGYHDRCEAIVHCSEDFDEIATPMCFQGITDDEGDDDSRWELLDD